MCIVHGEIHLSLSLFSDRIELPQKHVNSADNFCCMYGEITLASRKHTLTGAYFLYFGFKVGDENKTWVSDVCCTCSLSKVSAWTNQKGRSMLFVVLMIWRELINYLSDSCVGVVPPIQTGIAKKEKWAVE